MRSPTDHLHRQNPLPPAVQKTRVDTPGRSRHKRRLGPDCPEGKTLTAVNATDPVNLVDPSGADNPGMGPYDPPGTVYVDGNGDTVVVDDHGKPQVVQSSAESNRIANQVTAAGTVHYPFVPEEVANAPAGPHASGPQGGKEAAGVLAAWLSVIPVTAQIGIVGVLFIGAALGCVATAAVAAGAFAVLGILNIGAGALSWTVEKRAYGL